MTGLDQSFSRRTFLRATGALGATAGLGGVVAACNVVGSGGAKTTGTFNWMTWGDHWIQSQLDTIAKDTGITAKTSELAGNAEGYAKLKEVKGQLDKISGDAMWVPNAYNKDGLIEPFDIKSLKVSSQLYSFAREFPYWTTSGGYLAYPFGWSPIMIYYDPAKVSGDPTDWQVLLDPKYKGRIVVENQPEEIVAYMARAANFDKPYDLTDDQLATVKGYLEKLKPNVLKFAQQATDSVKSMITGEAWLITGNLGNEDRVKDGGGPVIKGYVPKEGTVGWHDGEMIVKGGTNQSLILPFLEKSQQAELIAENFLVNGRPLFNEKAYQLLVDQGKKDQVDRYLWTQAEAVLSKTVLKGPGTSTAKSIALFHEVFG